MKIPLPLLRLLVDFLDGQNRDIPRVRAELRAVERLIRLTGRYLHPKGPDDGVAVMAKINDVYGDIIRLRHQHLPDYRGTHEESKRNRG